MSSLDEAVQDFLAQRRIAVAGVSRSSDAAANFIYRRFRDAGYEVFAINPNAETVEGDRCYATIHEIPGGVDAVMFAAPPAAADGVVRQCAKAGVRRLWMHRSFGQGSVSDAAVKLCDELGIHVIAGACPMMYLAPVDFGHRCIRWILGVTGGLPKPHAISPDTQKAATLG
jgi:predicted CoA-binding protein